MNCSLVLTPLKSFIEYCGAKKIKPTKDAIVISIGEQKLFFYTHNVLEASYTVSTSRKPPSCKEDSFGTPIGLHKIEEKIGDGVPVGGVFIGRVYTGKHFSEFPPEERQKNLITTRILRLRGLEEGKNLGPGCDSYNRYIYIHGTNHQDRVGTPMTAGCPVLKDDDLVDIFNCSEEGMLVFITN